MAIQPDRRDLSERSQRLRVGLTGLALVVVLGGLAGAVFNAVSEEPAAGPTGNADAAIVAEVVTPANTATAVDSRTNEPLAELGVAPNTAPDNAAQTTPQR